ncbi:unnamed protein product, partial [Symbiodinium sp. CCMP2592]
DDDDLADLATTEANRMLRVRLRPRCFSHGRRSLPPGLREQVLEPAPQCHVIAKECHAGFCGIARGLIRVRFTVDSLLELSHEDALDFLPRREKRLQLLLMSQRLPENEVDPRRPLPL